MRRAVSAAAAAWAVAVAVAGAALGACGSSAGTAAKRTTSTTTRVAGPPTTTAACLLTETDARSLLGTAVKAAAAPSLPAGVPKPTAQCLFTSPANDSVELTTFSGTEMFSQLSILVNNAAPVPGLGESSYCGGGKGADTASFSCLFVQHSSTYVLAVAVPVAKDGPALHDRVKASALDVAKRAGA